MGRRICFYEATGQLSLSLTAQQVRSPHPEVGSRSRFLSWRGPESLIDQREVRAAIPQDGDTAACGAAVTVEAADSGQSLVFAYA